MDGSGPMGECGDRLWDRHVSHRFIVFSIITTTTTTHPFYLHVHLSLPPHLSLLTIQPTPKIFKFFPLLSNPKLSFRTKKKNRLYFERTFFINLFHLFRPNRSAENNVAAVSAAATTIPTFPSKS